MQPLQQKKKIDDMTRSFQSAKADLEKTAVPFIAQ